MVGLKIKSLMKMKHITQKELSEKTGISSGAISSYLSGHYEPKFDKLQLIANALGVSVAVFLESSNDDPVLQIINTLTELTKQGLITWKASFPSFNPAGCETWYDQTEYEACIFDTTYVVNPGDDRINKSAQLSVKNIELEQKNYQFICSNNSPEHIIAIKNLISEIVISLNDKTFIYDNLGKLLSLLDSKNSEKED